MEYDNIEQALLEDSIANRFPFDYFQYGTFYKRGVKIIFSNKMRRQTSFITWKSVRKVRY